MHYENVETYLNEEVRKPIKYYLKDVSPDKQEDIMELVDYLCDKYRETNATCLFYESKLPHDDKRFKEWQQFMEEKGYIRPIDYDELEDVFTEEELEVRLGI